MKECPVCGRKYGDDTLNFCLHDGVALKLAPDAELFDPDATLVEPSRTRQVEARRTDPVVSHSRTARHEPEITAAEDRTLIRDRSAGNKRRYTGLIVLLSVLGTLGVLAVGGLAAWLLMRPASGPIAVGNSSPKGSANNTPSNRNLNTAEKPAVSPTLARPVAQPTQQAAVDETDARQGIMRTINGWADATRSRDAETRMSYYADTIDPYYLKSNVSSSFVKAESQRAYSLFSTVDIQLSNVQIGIDPAGERAVATFDKSWDFGGSRPSSGAVQQQLWLQRFGDRWLITGEKDLKVYYKNR